MNISKKMFESFSLDCLSQREDLDKVKIMNAEDFLRYDLSIFSEREIVTILVNIAVFSDNEKELIKFWATLFKSKKLFEIVEDSNLTDTDFVTRLKESSCSKQFIELVFLINWKCAAIDVNNVYVASISGFYEEIAVKMARNNSLTVELIERFNLRGVDWNYKCAYGGTLLIQLCMSNAGIDVLKCLLCKEIDVNATDKYEGTAFMWLCANNFITLDMVKLFFDNKVDIDIRDDCGSTAFMYLCANASVTLDMIKLFFDKGANIALQDNDGDTAFVFLCNNKSITPELVELFLEKGVDLNIRNRYDLGSLDYYIENGGHDDKILKLLGQN